MPDIVSFQALGVPSLPNRPRLIPAQQGIAANADPLHIAPARFRYAHAGRHRAGAVAAGRLLLSTGMAASARRPSHTAAARALLPPRASPLCGDDEDRLLGLRTGKRRAADEKALNAMLDYADVCNLGNMTEKQDLLADWWARHRGYDAEYAADDLERARANICSLFFDAPPASRPGLWRHVSPAARSDVNLLLDIGAAVVLAPRPSDRGMGAAAYPMVAAALRYGCRANDSLQTSEVPYLMALNLVLREHGTGDHPLLRNRTEILPGDALHFVAAIMSPPETVAAPDRAADADGGATPAEEADAAFFLQRQQDLAALLHAARAGTCAANDTGPPTLSALRTRFQEAVHTQREDDAILKTMFGYAGPDSIYHDGITLRNAAGKNVHELVACLEQSNTSGFTQLDPARRTSLVRRRLLQLQENPDYPIGSALQSMASILMRMSGQPPGQQYRQYDSKLDLLECWELRNQQWIEQRDFAMSPELYNAMHLEGANGLSVSGLNWYRDLWESMIFRPLMDTPLARSGDRQAMARLWQWLAERAPGWQASGLGWGAISGQQFADSVTAAADALYQIRQARDLPRFEYTDMFGAGHMRFHSSLSGLPPAVQEALDGVAKQFDFTPFYRERILAENWLSTSYRLLDKSYYRTMLALQPQPSYSVEVEAYLTLLRNGISAEQMTEAKAQIVCAVDPSPFHAMPRPVYEAFIAVIRNPHRDARLLLPNGKVIRPHHIINESFEAYRNNIGKHPWVIGRAWQNLRERKLPFLPSLLDREIESIAAPLRRSASKATESGTQMADQFFGALPVSSPLLHIGRAFRDDNYRNVPYYALILARDVMAAVALSHAIGAAYISPLVTAARYGSSALLAATAMPRTYRIHSAGYIDLKPRMVRRQGKPHDITLTSDQTRGLQSKVVRTRNQGHAARQYSTSHRPDNATLFAGTHHHRFDPDDWHKMVRMMLPANEEEEFRQQQNILKIGTQNEHSLLNITISEHIEDAGARAGLLGLSEANAFTLCDGTILGERPTVHNVFNWMLKATNPRMRPVHKLLLDNLGVVHADGVEREWKTHPDRRYDPFDIVSQLYITSSRFRSLFNWHDDHCIEKQSIRIVIDTACAQAMVSRSAASSAVRITLPANPHALPFVMNEIHVHRQSIRQAIAESLVEAFTGQPPPAQPLRHRGVNIWLAGQVLLQEGRHFEPRINAATFDTPEQAGLVDQTAVSRIAELENQYLERIGVENQFGNPIRYQEEAVHQRPTVTAVTALLERIGYRAHLHEQKLPPRRDALTRADFLQRFRRVFVVDRGNCGNADNDMIGMIDLFFCECYSGSSLFRRIFDANIAQLTRHWTIFPNGFHGDGAPGEDLLIPSEGLINARSENAVYLGLMEVEPVPGQPALSQPVQQLLPLEPFRRMLDGVIAALCADLETPSRHDASRHRGATVWLSDAVIWQSGWPANKRLARIALSASDPGDARILRRLAGANRRTARIEDTYIVNWLNRRR